MPKIPIVLAALLSLLSACFHPATAQEAAKPAAEKPAAKAVPKAVVAVADVDGDFAFPGEYAGQFRLGEAACPARGGRARRESS